MFEKILTEVHLLVPQSLDLFTKYKILRRERIKLKKKHKRKALKKFTEYFVIRDKLLVLLARLRLLKRTPLKLVLLCISQY